jgi:hypothetical protein
VGVADETNGFRGVFLQFWDGLRCLERHCQCPLQQ